MSFLYSEIWFIVRFIFGDIYIYIFIFLFYFILFYLFIYLFFFFGGGADAQLSGQPSVLANAEVLVQPSIKFIKLSAICHEGNRK